LPAIATSMIAATGSAVRAAAQPQDQSQAPAGDSPFAILLAALSAQTTPAGEDAGADAALEVTTTSPLPGDQAEQDGKPVPAAAEKSNAADHVAQAALAALLNTPAAPPPFSLPPTEASETTSSTFLPDAPPTTPADKDKPKSPAENSPTAAGGQSASAALPSTGAPDDPVLPVLGDAPVAPSFNDASDPKIADASAPSTSTDPIPVAPGNDPLAPMATGGRSDPTTKIADASTADIAPTGKAPTGKAPTGKAPEKKLAAPDKPDADAVTEAEAAPAMVAAAYAVPAAGQPSADQATKTAATIDTPAIAYISANAAPEAGAKPAKDMVASAPVSATLADDDDADPSSASDASPENAGSISTLLAVATKTATAPVKSAGAKPAPNKNAAPDGPVSASQDRPQMPAPAQNNMKAPSHVAAQKTEASAPPPSGDDSKPAQTDPPPVVVPAAAAAVAHAAPPSQQAAIFDPSIIVSPHSAPASASGTPAAAGLEVTNAVSDPVPDLNGFAVSIAARSLSGAKQFEIRLDPPELGRVDVRLSIDATGKAVAHMTADQPQALDLLRKDAPALTQALRDAGLDVSQNGLNFSLRGQDRQNGDSGGHGRRSNLSARLAIQAVQAPAALAYAGSVSNARLDIHV